MENKKEANKKSSTIWTVILIILTVSSIGLRRCNRQEQRRMDAMHQSMYEIISQFAISSETQSHRNSARNPNTPIERLEELASDDDYIVRAFVAGNPSTPVEILKKLARDSMLVVLTAVAENPNTPAEILEKIANKKEEGTPVRSPEIIF